MMPHGMRLHRRCCFISFLSLLSMVLTLSAVLHYWVTEIPRAGDGRSERTSDVWRDGVDCAACLTEEIGELTRVRDSVLEELKTLEKKYHRIQAEISSRRNDLADIGKHMEARRTEIEQLHAKYEQTKRALREEAEANMPLVWSPLSIQPGGPHVLRADVPVPELDQLLDFSRCSLLRPLRVFYYDIDPSTDVTGRMLSDWSRTSTYVSSDSEESCIFMAFLSCDVLKALTTAGQFVEFLKSKLKHFNDGANHIIILDPVATDCITFALPDLRCIFLQATLTQKRHSADLNVLPVLPGPLDVLSQFAPLLPLRRETFLTVLWRELEPSGTLTAVLDRMRETSKKDKINILNEWISSDHLQSTLSHSTFVLIFTNKNSSKPSTKRSTAPASVDGGSPGTVPTGAGAATHLAVALRSGAIPVLVGKADLPFDEVIDWNKALIRWPLPRLPELHFVLSTLPDSVIADMRRQGRLISEKYFGDLTTLMYSIVGLWRFRLKTPPEPLSESVKWISTETLKRAKMPLLPETDEYLGPMEEPVESPTFQHNYSTLFDPHTAWNSFRFSPTTLYPSLPFQGPLPSEAKFKGSGYGFRPINDGLGGSGKPFSEALGGNFPREQFTVVMATFERVPVLIESLRRLDNLPYLNKVLVVWNSRTSPDPDMVWPELSVPVEVVLPERNSLNNRFFPYEGIRTDAVLSIDDDVHLRHDEIVFGFRVWREFRDQIVGFPGRYHGYDLMQHSWMYQSNHSCELSMVLTGAAFVHKVPFVMRPHDTTLLLDAFCDFASVTCFTVYFDLPSFPLRTMPTWMLAESPKARLLSHVDPMRMYYFHVYTYEMSPLVRQKVDELMNCEDLAMNFLVSHLTRKPPVKATSRWTFNCPGCPDQLSKDESHFLERHDCINFFTRVFGYNPLLYTQVRVDSILFKTRLPSAHRKCYKFV